MVQNEGPARTGVRTREQPRDVRAEYLDTGRDSGPGARDPSDAAPRPFTNEDAAAVLQALDPFWTRGIVAD